jgi:hypothetical protein
MGRAARAELNPEAEPTTDTHAITSAHPAIASFDTGVRTVICFDKSGMRTRASATLTSNPKLGR